MKEVGFERWAELVKHSETYIYTYFSVEWVNG